MGREPHGFIAINRRLQLNTMLFDDDLVLLATSGEDLQSSICNWSTAATKYHLEISTEKTKRERTYTK